jgi:hypothetical protein
MAQGKFGGQSVLFLVDGYSLIANKLKGLRYKHEALQERSEGLGDSAEESTPTGMTKVELAQEGGFFDTTANRVHAMMVRSNAVPTHPQVTPRVVCLGFAGQVVGNAFVGLQGAFTTVYEVLAQLGQLTKANVMYVVSGVLNNGIILQELETKTDDWDTSQAGEYVDNLASSANGGVGYLQVTDFAGPNGLVVTIRHSDSPTTGYSDLITFSTVTGAQTAQRVEVSGTVKRYTCVKGAGFGNVSPSVSGSASVSPSSSRSPSASVSLSPSASLSPSTSTSRSPSSSLSPSASTSLSPSTSISPSVSASVSASASLSPSRSLSPSASVSPSAGAALASSVTLFVGLARG